MRDKDNDLIVIKANELVQKYKYTLSKTEIRIVNTIISNIKSPKYDEELNMMEFSIKEFCQLLGIEHAGGENYRILKETLRNLSNKTSDYIDFGEYETIVRWIEKPIFEKGSGIVRLKLDDELKPFLLQVSGTIQAKLKYYFDMDSKYSMRLYELLKSWDGFPAYTYEVEELKLCIDARKDSYNSFGKFRQTVLDPAVKEINQVTDLLVSYTTKAKGRKITHVTFSILKKTDAVKKKTAKQEHEKLEPVDIAEEKEQDLEIETYYQRKAEELGVTIEEAKDILVKQLREQFTKENNHGGAI